MLSLVWIMQQKQIFIEVQTIIFRTINFIISYFNIKISSAELCMSYSSRYIQKELVGRGFFGKVYLVYDKTTSKPYVAKKIQFQGMSEEERKSTLRQVEIHQQLKHKNILQFKEHFLQNDLLIMIMDYCEFGDLSVYIKTRKETRDFFEEAIIINLFVQMLFGLNYLHERKILHRDIKTQNIFIDSEGTIKLADFGISKILQCTNHLASTIVGTPYYLSPQACNNKGYSFKSDIWSLGCVLYELCSLQHPFKGDNILFLAKKISTEQPSSIPSQYSNQLWNLIQNMLKKNPSERPTIRQILESKFISEYLIKFKMQKQSQQHLVQQFPIFETECSLQSESMNIEQSHNQLEQTGGFISSTSPPRKKTTGNMADEIKISPKKSGLQSLRQKCIQKMGSNLFSQIYNFMKKCKNSMDEYQIQESLKKKYSKKQFQLSMDIAQLIYLQDNS